MGPREVSRRTDISEMEGWRVVGRGEGEGERKVWGREKG